MPAQATVALEKAKRLEPEKASIREALGIAYFRITRWQEAEAEFRKVLELSPADDYAHYALGRALRNQGRHDEAATHLSSPARFGRDRRAEELRAHGDDERRRRPSLPAICRGPRRATRSAKPARGAARRTHAGTRPHCPSSSVAA